jgi:hypothetical protein
MQVWPLKPRFFFLKPRKNKKPTWTSISGTWALEFLGSAVLGPQQPQSRNVVLPTGTALTATTHGLARKAHQLERLRGAVRGVNAECSCEKPMLANSNLDARRGWEVTRARSVLLGSVPVRHILKSAYQD